MAYKGNFASRWDFHVELIHDALGARRVVEVDVLKHQLALLNNLEGAMLAFAHIERGDFINDGEHRLGSLFGRSDARHVTSLCSNTHVAEEEHIAAGEDLSLIETPLDDEQLDTDQEEDADVEHASSCTQRIISAHLVRFGNDVLHGADE